MTGDDPTVKKNTTKEKPDRIILRKQGIILLLVWAFMSFFFGPQARQGAQSLDYKRKVILKDLSGTVLTTQREKEEHYSSKSCLEHESLVFFSFSHRYSLNRYIQSIHSSFSLHFCSQTLKWRWRSGLSVYRWSVFEAPDGTAITFTTQQINSKRLPGRPLICDVVCWR